MSWSNSVSSLPKVFVYFLISVNVPGSNASTILAKSIVKFSGLIIFSKVVPLSSNCLVLSKGLLIGTPLLSLPLLKK